MTMHNDRYHARTIDINMDYTTIRAIELELNQQEKNMFFYQSTCSEKKEKHTRQPQINILTQLNKKKCVNSTQTFRIQ